MLYDVPVEIEEEQKPKAKPKRKEKRRSTLGCHICRGHNSTKNSKRSINPAVKQVATTTTTTTTKQKLVAHFCSCCQRKESQANMLSRCAKDIKEKDLEIKQKNKEITRLTGYKSRAEEADDKAFLKQQKFKQ